MSGIERPRSRSRTESVDHKADRSRRDRAIPRNFLSDSRFWGERPTEAQARELL